MSKKAPTHGLSLEEMHRIFNSYGAGNNLLRTSSDPDDAELMLTDALEEIQGLEFQITNAIQRLSDDPDVDLTSAIDENNVEMCDVKDRLLKATAQLDLANQELDRVGNKNHQLKYELDTALRMLAILSKKYETSHAAPKA